MSDTFPRGHDPLCPAAMGCGCECNCAAGRRMVYLVVLDDGNSQEAEIDIDSIWDTDAEANERKAQITDAQRVWVESRRIGETGTVYH